MLCGGLSEPPCPDGATLPLTPASQSLADVSDTTLGPSVRDATPKITLEEGILSLGFKLGRPCSLWDAGEMSLSKLSLVHTGNVCLCVLAPGTGTLTHWSCYALVIKNTSIFPDASLRWQTRP